MARKSSKQTRKQTRNTEFYLAKLKVHIRTPLQRLRNVQLAHRALRDFLYDRTSNEVVDEVVRRVKELDSEAEKRGVADPVAMAGDSTESLKQYLRNVKVTHRKQ